MYNNDIDFVLCKKPKQTINLQTYTYFAGEICIFQKSIIFKA